MTTIAPATDVGTLADTLLNMRQTANSINTLTSEVSSGYVSTEYAGLGTGASAALYLTGALALNTTQQGNAASAGTVQQITQTALGQIQTLVTGVANQLLGVGTSTGVGMATIAASANDALSQIAGLLDTKVAGIYVFAGQDSTNPPVPDPATITSSAFYTAIQTAVAGLATNGAATVLSQTLTIASVGGTSPFSPTLEASNQPATVDLGTGETVQVGMLADQNTNAVSAGTGTTSTGSYMRDIFMSLATLGSMGAANTDQVPVQGLISGIETTLNGASLALNTDIGGLGVRQDSITSAQTELSDVATTLTTQLGTLQDADQAAVATQLASAQSRLQASYAVVAALGQLTLAKYLT